MVTKLIQKGTSAYITLRTEYDLNDNVLSQIGHPGDADAITIYAYDAVDRVTQFTDEGSDVKRDLRYDAGTTCPGRSTGTARPSSSPTTAATCLTTKTYDAGHQRPGARPRPFLV